MSSRRQITKTSRKGLRKGFTLVEILLAMTLSAALVAGLWTAITVHLKAYEHGREEVERAQLFRALARRVTADVTGAVSAGALGALPIVQVASIVTEPEPGAVAETGAAPRSGLNLGMAGRGPTTGAAPLPKGPPAPAGAAAPRATAQPLATPGAAKPPAPSKGKTAGAPLAASAASAHPVSLHKTIATAGALQLSGGSRWLEITLAPWVVPHPDDALEDDSQRAKRSRPRTVRYYLGIPGDPWMEVMAADDGPIVRGVLVRREQLPPVPHELIPGDVPLPMESPAASADVVDPMPTPLGLAPEPAAPEIVGAASTEGMLPETLSLTEIPEISSLSLRYYDGSGWQSHWHSGEMGRLPLAIEALWAMAKPLKHPSGRRGRVATDEQRAAYDQLLTAIDPFAEYLLDGPNLPPDLSVENSPWQVGRAVIPIPQGQLPAPAPERAPPAGPVPPTADPMSTSAAPMPVAAPGRLR